MFLLTQNLHSASNCSFPDQTILNSMGGVTVEHVDDSTGPANAIVRDVTPRYASDWCSRVYKQRLDREWWAESLRPFEPSSLEEKEDEDEDITGKLVCNWFHMDLGVSPCPRMYCT